MTKKYHSPSVRVISLSSETPLLAYSNYVYEDKNPNQPAGTRRREFSSGTIWSHSDEE